MSTASQTEYSSEAFLPKKLMDEVEKVAKARKLSADQKEKLIKEVRTVYQDSRFEPGESLGIIAAQSISEPATQMTMRTYHFAGTAGIKVTYGLPRLIEIFDAKKELETPMMTIHLKQEFNTAEGARKFAEEIVEKKITNVTKKVALNLNENSIEIEPLDKRKTDSMANTIKEQFKELTIRTRGDKIVVIAGDEVNIKDLEKLKEKIMAVQFSGIKDVSNGVVRREGDDWVINTIGSNMEKVLSMKEVDDKRTFTNDIYETSTYLGIEAARNLIIMEAIKTLQEQGLNVDVRHIMLVADIMTFRGDVRSIGRYGVAGGKSSILARAAFEETIKHLVKASIRGEEDSFSGVFENVMIGQVIPSGTGMFDLVANFEEQDKK